VLNRLTFLGVVGFLLAALGAAIAKLNWPGTTANVGLALLGVGSMVLGGVVIAVGVYCGLRMHEERGQLGGGRHGSSRQVSTATAEPLNREAKQRIAARRAADEPADA
jgi:hypothetical protein